MKNKGTVYVIENKGNFLMGYHNDERNTLTTELSWSDAWEQAQKHFVKEGEEINPITLSQLKRLAKAFGGRVAKVTYQYEIEDLDGNKIKEPQETADELQKAFELFLEKRGVNNDR